jgi:hypothetical protein
MKVGGGIFSRKNSDVVRDMKVERVVPGGFKGNIFGVAS